MPASRAQGQSSCLLACDQMNTVTRQLPAAPSPNLAHTPHGFRSPAAAQGPAMGFNGQRLERQGNYLLGNGYRTYSPQLQRFFSPDSFSPFGRGGINAYAYCGLDPVNSRDPSGRISMFKAFLPYAALGAGAILLTVGGILTKTGKNEEGVNPNASTAMMLFGIGAGLAITGGVGVINVKKTLGKERKASLAAQATPGEVPAGTSPPSPVQSQRKRSSNIDSEPRSPESRRASTTASEREAVERLTAELTTIGLPPTSGTTLPGSRFNTLGARNSRTRYSI